jgi:DNA-directed RNA polymerase subunit E'/Rpb7
MEIYTDTTFEENISLPFNKSLTSDLNSYFMSYSKLYIEGKCRKEGYIKPDSVKIEYISNGLLKENNVSFKVKYTAKTCLPSKNILIKAKIKNITKIGIRAVISDLNNPIVLFVSSEHNKDKNMESYIIGQTIQLNIIDFRFELYDDFISAIAEIVD